MRVAIVHDWLTGMRGGERVLEALLMLLPDADIFTLIHVRGTVSPAIEERRITTSFIDHLPGVQHYYRYCLPFFPAAVDRLDLRGYDLVVSSSHCAAKAVRTHGAPHLCYCHTPMRYAWDQRRASFGATAGARVRQRLLEPALERLRRWDVTTAARVRLFVANSRHVQARIARSYGRSAHVVHPPVRTDLFAPAAGRDDAYVCAGALVAYKRVDLAIAAFNASGKRLLVVGDGPQYSQLRRGARRNVEFMGRLPDPDLAAVLARARALIMPMVEDFGIIAVEAQAAGTPVIAFSRGGALETVVPGLTGLLFHEQTPASLNATVAAAERLTFDTNVLRRNAERFSVPVFERGMRAALARVMESAEPALAGVP